jgi:carbamoyl-phosphate synthase large subunit
MNILILSCSRKVLLIKSFKTYINNLGGKIYCCDIDINSPALYFSDEFFICPKSDNENYINFIKNKCIEKNIKLIIPTRCEELEVFSINKQYFLNLGINIMVCNNKSLNICQNKKKFIEFCIDNNYPIPKTYNKIEEIQKYPVFIKPVKGSSGKNIQKINCKDELRLINFEYFVVQEFIDWKEYTIDYLSDFDGNYISCIPRERIKVINGESCVSKININEKITDLCRNIGSNLKLIGHNTLQCFFNGEYVKFIEINPRFGGAANLGINSGLNSPMNIINLLFKKPLKIDTPSNNLLMLRYSNDCLGYIKNNKFIDINVINNNKIYCIDIDGTICTELCEYKDAIPITKVINKINLLYDDGNYIKLFTARGSKSKTNWRELTEKQLKEWGVKYHELILGKPYADYYIDNKAIDVLDWI